MANQPWERLPNEGPEAYRAFLIFRDLGPGRNSDRVGEVLKECGMSAGRGQRTGRLAKWSSDYRWLERARAWDDHLQAERDRKLAETSAAEAAKWEARRQRALDRGWENAEALYAQARRMLDWPMQTQRTSRDGKKVVIRPARWSKDTMAKVMKLAIDLEAAVLTAASKDPEELSDAEARATAEESGEGTPPAA